VNPKTDKSQKSFNIARYFCGDLLLLNNIDAVLQD